MRSSGFTNLALAWSVVARTKSTIACFAAPSFHDASGAPDVACASADVERSALDNAGSRAIPAMAVRRLMSDGEWSDFIFGLLGSVRRIGQPTTLSRDLAMA